MRSVQIVFSPTGGTQKVADILTNRISDDVERIDLSNRTLNFGATQIRPDDLVVVAMPCFAGRVPRIALERFGQISGNGAKCVVVNVYGNRAFDDALLEMSDSASAVGFEVIASIAAVAEHSIMNKFATGRPDAIDCQTLESYADRIKEALESGKAISMPPTPGKRPYVKEGSASLVPKVKGGCTKCGLCERKCPVGAINQNDFPSKKGSCISCMRCVSICPANARQINKLMVKAASLAIGKEASKRKENELFLELR